MPLYIKKRLDTLYSALFALDNTEVVERAFEALEKLLYDELVANNTNNHVRVYANAVSIINMVKINDGSNIGILLADARREVESRRQFKLDKDNA